MYIYKPPRISGVIGGWVKVDAVQRIFTIRCRDTHGLWKEGKVLKTFTWYMYKRYVAKRRFPLIEFDMIWFVFMQNTYLAGTSAFVTSHQEQHFPLLRGVSWHVGYRSSLADLSTRRKQLGKHITTTIPWMQRAAYERKRKFRVGKSSYSRLHASVQKLGFSWLSTLTRLCWSCLKTPQVNWHR